MSYKVDGTDMLGWFYPYTSSTSNTNTAAITNYKIDGDDIYSSYAGIGTNSNIPVSTLYPTIAYYKNNISIGTKFELNLPLFSGTKNTNYKIWSPSNHGGLLIQILSGAPTYLQFNYNISSCQFLMIGGGGGGGNTASGNAGGGGGAGELVTGTITNYVKNTKLSIILGDGGGSQSNGSDTSIIYNNYMVTAEPGTHGGSGKGSSGSANGSSGGTGSYSNDAPNLGSAININPITDVSIFSYMTSFNNTGSYGNYQHNDTGGGGGGGGAGGAASNTTTSDGTGTGGVGKTIKYGNTSFTLGGGGGGGGRGGEYNGAGGEGGEGGGGAGGTYTGSSGSTGNGIGATVNTGGGGGGGQNDGGYGGTGGYGGHGGSGTVIFYILPTGVTL